MHKREAERGEVMIPKRRALGPYATNKLANQANIQSGKQKLPKPSLLRADSDSSTGSAPALMPTGRRSSIGVVKSSKRRTSLEQNLGATMSKIEEASSAVRIAKGLVTSKGSSQVARRQSSTSNASGNSSRVGTRSSSGSARAVNTQQKQQALAALEAAKQELTQSKAENVKLLEQHDSVVASHDTLKACHNLVCEERNTFKDKYETEVSRRQGLEETLEALNVKHCATSEELAQNQTRVAELEALVAQQQAEVLAAEGQRRRMHNQIQDLKGSIRVFCRVRPLLPKESAAASASADKPMASSSLVGRRTRRSSGVYSAGGCDNATAVAAAAGAATGKLKMAIEVPTTDLEQRRLRLCGENVAAASGVENTRGCKNHDFSFDRVFGPHEDQSSVFYEVGELVQSVLDGYNACVFAYGQTGSGKTFTMEGAIGGDGSELGIIPRSVERLFEVRDRMISLQGWQFDMQASQLEIYNENIRDLLVSPGNAPSEEFKIKHGARDGSTTVTNLTSHVVSKQQDVLNLLKLAQSNRSVAATKCNAQSSRSHSVFLLTVSAVHPESGQTRRGRLVLVDLAGSERLDQSGAQGVQLKEAQAINKSLSALGNVIVALGNKQNHVPFRDSKLTYLLQNCLGGDSKCLMLVNVSPAVPHVNETLCSLRFAQKVNACEVGPAKKHSS